MDVAVAFAGNDDVAFYGAVVFAALNAAEFTSPSVLVEDLDVEAAEACHLASAFLSELEDAGLDLCKAKGSHLCIPACGSGHGLAVVLCLADHPDCAGVDVGIAGCACHALDIEVLAVQHEGELVEAAHCSEFGVFGEEVGVEFHVGKLERSAGEGDCVSLGDVQDRHEGIVGADVRLGAVDGDFNERAAFPGEGVESGRIVGFHAGEGDSAGRFRGDALCGAEAEGDLTSRSVDGIGDDDGVDCAVEHFLGSIVVP